jgi:hypothetical protein
MNTLVSSVPSQLDEHMNLTLIRQILACFSIATIEMSTTLQIPALRS